MIPHFREARMVELHDAGVVMQVEAYTPAYPEASAIQSSRLSIDGDALGHLLKALGIPFDADLLYGDRFDVVVRHPAESGWRRPEFPGRGILRIRHLRVRPDGPRLLTLRVTARLLDGEPEAAQEITYSGSYTVWWAETVEPDPLHVEEAPGVTEPRPDVRSEHSLEGSTDGKEEHTRDGPRRKARTNAPGHAPRRAGSA